MTTAIAHPNIALVKYWGKQNKILNHPASPSLSITLDSLITKTKVSASTETRLLLNGKRNDGTQSTNAKIKRLKNEAK